MFTLITVKFYNFQWLESILFSIFNISHKLFYVILYIFTINLRKFITHIDANLTNGWKIFSYPPKNIIFPQKVTTGTTYACLLRELGVKVCIYISRSIAEIRISA